MINLIWLGFLTILINIGVLGRLLPIMFSSKSDELVLLSPIVFGVLMTADYYIIKYIQKKVENGK